jgi:hypothetical protein
MRKTLTLVFQGSKLESSCPRVRLETIKNHLPCWKVVMEYQTYVSNSHFPTLASSRSGSKGLKVNTLISAFPKAPLVDAY